MVTDIKWSGLTGVIDDGRHEASINLITENDEPLWVCLFNRIGGDTFVREFFEVGKLEQAYEWCVNILKEDE